MKDSTAEASRPGPETTYTCVAGHEIPGADLQALTQIETLDAGAEVRLCREHGAPIAETIVPEANTTDGAP